MPLDNLWPEDLAVEEVIDTPGLILRQQTGGLRERTRDLVEAEVTSMPSGNQIVHRFYLTAPSLAYRAPLFEVRHGLAPYPATIGEFQGFEGPRRVSDSEELRGALREIFNHELTRKTVGQLRAYALERGLPYLLVEDREIVGEAKTLALAMRKAREVVSMDSEVVVMQNGAKVGSVRNQEGDVTERVAGPGTL